MRILIFTDTHGSERAMRSIIEQSHNADILVCAGDFTIFENSLESILSKLNSIGKPVVLIHGNHESASTVSAASVNLKNIHFIHKTYYIKYDIAFFGYGGGGFSTNDPKFDIAAKVFIDELKSLEKKNNISYRIVLVTHAPPHGTALDDLGTHVGCHNFTKFIVDNKPALAVSGHIHETAGEEDRINSTLLINPGPHGRIIDI